MSLLSQLMNATLVFARRLMDVYLQQNITPHTDMLANYVAKIVIISMLNGIPSKHNKVFSLLYVFIV